MPEEKGFGLQQRVGMFLQEQQRHAASQPLECLAVYAEPHTSRQSNIAHLFPVSPVFIEQVDDTVALLLQPFESESREPIGQEDGRQFVQSFPAGQSLALRREVGVVGFQLFGNRYDPLGNRFSVGAGDGGVGFGNDVQNHRVVGSVFVVSMRQPVTRPQMHLHVSRPYTVSDTHFGVEKVGSRIDVASSGVDDFDKSAVSRLWGSMSQEPVFPHIIKQLFHTKQVYMQNKGISVVNTTF